MFAARLCALVLAGIVGAIPLVPTEHVHEVEEHGHVEFVVHRHLQSHGVVPEHHDDRHALDHQDAPVATLCQDYTVPAGVSLAVPAVFRIVAFIEPPVLTRSISIEFVERLIHGPPRAPTAERGPPSSYLL